MCKVQMAVARAEHQVGAFKGPVVVLADMDKAEMDAAVAKGLQGCNMEVQTSWLTHSLIHSLAHSLTRSLAYSLAHPPASTPTHPPTRYMSSPRVMSGMQVRSSLDEAHAFCSQQHVLICSQGCGVSASSKLVCTVYAFGCSVSISSHSPPKGLPYHNFSKNCASSQSWYPNCNCTHSM